MMSQVRRRQFLLAVGAGSLWVSLPALAQQKKRVRRIGFLTAGSVASAASYLASFRQGMTELHWVEGRDYIIDSRHGDNVPQRIAGFAAELVATQPDLLLTSAGPAIPALAQVTKTIPIVFGIATDPVKSGFARSLQRPGGNLTGLTTLSHELSAKRLEMLRDTLPGMAHVAVLVEPANPASLLDLKEIEQAAVRLRLRVTRIEMRQAVDIAPGFKRGAALGIHAYMVPAGPLFRAESRAVANSALQFKVPGIATSSANVETGQLMSYGASNDDNFRRAAAYVDKILKGAKPGDLPIEQPTRFELVLNLKTAKAMGIKFPQSILVRADRVIE